MLPTVASDGAGGAIVAWYDSRSGNADIYAQRISAAGAVEWTPDGVALCTAPDIQQFPTLASDGANGAIVAWEDYRSGTSDVYAQRVQANGELGGGAVGVLGETALAFALEPVGPNPTRGGVMTVRFTLPRTMAASLELLDVAGRRIARRDVGSFGAGCHALQLDESRRLAPGLYLVRLTQGVNVRVARVAVVH